LRGNGLAGDYLGQWKFPEPEKLGQVGLGISPEGELETIWVPQEEVENVAKLTLTERL